MSSAKASLTEETDLKKKLKKKMRKALFGEELRKDLYFDGGWETKFYGTDKEVEALELMRECRRNQRARDQESLKIRKPWREVDAMKPVERAKHQQRVDEIQKKHDKRCEELRQKKTDMEDWLLDRKIEQAKAAMAQRKISAAKALAGIVGRAAMASEARAAKRETTTASGRVLPKVAKSCHLSKAANPFAGGGHVQMGKTGSGKPIHGPSSYHQMVSQRNTGVNSANLHAKNTTKTYGYTHQDHLDAHKFHANQAGQAKTPQAREAHSQLAVQHKKMATSMKPAAKPSLMGRIKQKLTGKSLENDIEKAARKKPMGHAAYTRTSKKTGKMSQVQAKGVSPAMKQLMAADKKKAKEHYANARKYSKTHPELAKLYATAATGRDELSRMSYRGTDDAAYTGFHRPTTRAEKKIRRMHARGLPKAEFSAADKKQWERLDRWEYEGRRLSERDKKTLESLRDRAYASGYIKSLEESALERLQKAVHKKPTGHAAYTRTSKTGKMSQVQASGVPRYSVKEGNKLYFGDKHVATQPEGKGESAESVAGKMNKWVDEHGHKPAEYHGNNVAVLMEKMKAGKLGPNQAYALRASIDLEQHHKQAGKTEKSMVKSEQQALARLEVRLEKASNSPDVDIDAGRMGVADYTGEEGQVAMRVRHNQKCAGCVHYAVDHSACSIGLLPSVCGDGSYPEVGYAPAQPNRIAAKNWVSRHQDAVAEPAQASNVGTEAGEVSYRVEVLGDSALALSERMSLVKAAARDWGAIAGHIWHHVAGPKARAKWARSECGGKKPEEGKGKPPKEFIEHIKAKAKKGRKLQRSLEGQWVAKALSDLSGVVVMPHSAEVDLSKGKLSLGEFAEAMGTTDEIVRSIARRLGDKDHFAHFIKSKLPDIQVAHGLTDADMEGLYRAAVGTVEKLSPTDWEAWKGADFEGGVTDAALAAAIQQHGLLDSNALVRGGIVAPALPVQQLPDPEPIAQPLETVPANLGFVGGNLHLANDLHRF